MSKTSCWGRKSFLW